MSASEVPPFPHEDSTLVDPHAWRASINAVGKRFDLTVLARTKERVISRTSIADVPRGTALTLSYVNRQGPDELTAGPSYSWNESGRLVTRVWYEPDTVLYRSSTYVISPSGMLKSYEHAARSQSPGPGDTLTVLTEYFEEGGALAGASYDLFAGGQKQSQWWWEGVPVTAREWDAYRRAGPGKG